MARGAAAKGPKVKTRPYSLFHRMKLTIGNESSQTQKFLAEVQERFGKGPHEVLIVVGREEGLTPDKALAGFAERKDFSGELEVAADSAFVKMPVEVEHTKRAKVGKPKK
jgi:hypothetical protein